jgi:hypothetical protein
MINREKFNFEIIAEKCLDKYWGKAQVLVGCEGWDELSPAHKFALKWTKKNIRRFNKMTFSQIYKEYLVILRQE